MHSAVACITSIYVASFFISPVNGFSRGCDVNQTLFVPEGSNATFQANITDSFMHIEFKKESRRMFLAFLHGTTFISDDDIDVAYLDDDFDFDKRSYIHTNGQRFNDTSATLTIILTDVETADNGTYTLDVRSRVCWILFVMEIHQHPVGIVEENQPVYFFAHPAASLMIRPLVNVTLVWLLGGMNINQTATYVEQDGLIWIAHVTRDMDGMNVTYRSVQDNGVINEVNYTLDVAYGPSGPLMLTPSKSQYYLTSGHYMPSIACTVDCKPQCTVTWGEHSHGNILNLGMVTFSNTGEYICTATRTGSNAVVERRINVYVTDNTAFTYAIAALASVQALTLGIGVCSICFYLRKKASPCHTRFKRYTSKAPSIAVISDSPGNSDQNTSEFAQYEDLNPETRHAPEGIHYGHVNSTGSQSDNGLELYENAQIA